MAYANACKFVPTAGGTTDFTYSAAVTGYASPAVSGVRDGLSYYYRAESADLSQWEIGVGVFSGNGTVLARSGIILSSTGAKVSFTVAPRVGLVAVAEGFREKITAQRTLYVRTDGNDANSGLYNTTAGAFRTIQKAVDAACALDLSIYSLVISVADGTYAEGIDLRKYVGAGPITIQGNLTTPANVIVSATADDCFAAFGVGAWALAGMKLQTATSGYGVNAQNATAITLNKVDFGAVAAGYAHIGSSVGASVNVIGNYTISGGGWAHLYAYNGGYITSNSGLTITTSGTPAFVQAFAFASTQSLILFGGQTFAGTGATGTRYSSYINSSIYVAGGGANYFPGSVAGSATIGGQYL
jgi:hypothetical protein